MISWRKRYRKFGSDVVPFTRPNDIDIIEAINFCWPDPPFPATSQFARGAEAVVEPQATSKNGGRGGGEAVSWHTGRTLRGLNRPQIFWINFIMRRPFIFQHLVTDIAAEVLPSRRSRIEAKMKGQV